MPTPEGEASGNPLPLHLLHEGGATLPKWCWYDVWNIQKMQFIYIYLSQYKLQEVMMQDFKMEH